MSIQYGALYHDIIDCLTKALEAKDYYTKGHSQRVADMTFFLAEKMGIKGYKLEELHMAAHLHDIGKIGVPDYILNKKSALTVKEFQYIKLHPHTGYEILNESKKLKGIAKIVLHHHERWDGKGYPQGIKGLNIPLGARIIAICDSIDAMTSKRPYREALDITECKREIIKNKGIMYDPDIVEVAVIYWDELLGKVI